MVKLILNFVIVPAFWILRKFVTFKFCILFMYLHENTNANTNKNHLFYNNKTYLMDVNDILQFVTVLKEYFKCFI